MLVSDIRVKQCLENIEAIMVGGEAISEKLAKEVKEVCSRIYIVLKKINDILDIIL